MAGELISLFLRVIRVQPGNGGSVTFIGQVSMVLTLDRLTILLTGLTST